MPGLFGERTGGRLAVVADSSCSAMAVGLALWLAGPMSAPACAAQPELVRMGGTNGNIVTSARIGTTLYVGGYFTRAGPVTGTSVLLDPDTGDLHPAAWPNFTGEVNAAIPDGKGGWFLGGSMTAIAGEAHGGLAHVDSRGRVRSWDPRPDEPVLALAMMGDTLFAGGRFSRVSGAPRRSLAAFRIRTGELLEALPEPNGEVRALLADGPRLYVGGRFDSLGAVLRGPLVALDLASWGLSSWVPVVPGLPQPGVFGTTNVLTKAGDHLLAGGSYYPERCLVAFSTETGEIENWPPQVTGPFDRYFGGAEVIALAVQDSNVFIGGRFSTVGGYRRGGLARLGVPSGVVSSWDPRLEPWLFGDFSSLVTAMLARGRTLYLGGSFETVSDSARTYIAAVDTDSGALLPWAIGTEHLVRAFAVDGDRLLAGGYFTGAGSQWKEWRDDLAAFDLTTGALKPWSPSYSGFGVEALAAVGGQIVVGSYFDALGGRARYCLGAVDTLTGAATEWDPALDGPVLELTAAGDTLYVGGAFTRAMGESRANVARFDMTTGALMPWAPMMNSYVGTIEPAGDRVFLAGGFRTINGIERPYLAAVDVQTGALDAFDPQLDDGVSALVARGDTLYVAGGLGPLGSATNSILAALDAHSGEVLFSVGGRQYATSLIMADSVLYVGGIFPEVGGVRRAALAAVSARSGAVLPLDAQLNQSVYGLAEHGGTLFVLGGFRSALESPTLGLVGLRLERLAPPAPSPPVELSLSDLWPNPVPGSSVLTEFVTPYSGELSVEIFDVQGRRVSTAASRRPVSPGRYRLEIPVRRLGEGVYLCRVELSGRALTKKLLVLR